MHSLKYLCIVTSALSPGLYYTTISNVESYSVISKTTKLSQKLSDPKTLKLWHDRLGHPGAPMLRKNLDNSFAHSLENNQLTIPSGYLCTPCS